MTKKLLTQSEKTQERLRSHLEVTDPKSFPTNPQGYNHRAECAFMKLATHDSAIVRAALAAEPMVRNMFITAMAANEQDPKVLKALQPRVAAMASKRSTDQQTIADQKATIAKLQKQLGKKK